MESNTEHADINKNLEPTTEADVVSEKDEIEDFSYDSDQNVITEVNQSPAKIAKAVEEKDVITTETEICVEEVEAQSDEGEGIGDNIVVETLQVIKHHESPIAPVASGNNEQYTLNTTNLVVTEQDIAASNKKAEEIKKEKEDGGQEDIFDSTEAHATAKETVEKAPNSNDVEEIQIKKRENVKTPTTESLIAATLSEQTQYNHQANLEKHGKNAVTDIISDLDSSVEQESIDLPKQEQGILLKQEELSKEKFQQQLIAQQLAAENHIHQQELQLQQKQQPEQSESQAEQESQKKETMYENQPTLRQYQPKENISNGLVVEENQDEHNYIQRGDISKSKEFSTKHVDLDKIFTPATDAANILPKNRKLYASSAFYSPALHPTVEDQVELARRISYSLSDISNQKSKGQSMYANRKKRSVKWVHEGTGQDNYQQQQQVQPSTSPSILLAYSDAGKHRVQLNLHQQQVLEKYVKPSLKVVKTPWEAALETGSASTAFVETTKLSPHRTTSPKLSAAPVQVSMSYNDGRAAAECCTVPNKKLPHISKPVSGNNPHRDLAYKPRLPQGWKSPGVTLPRELYLPKEISLESYARAPIAHMKQPDSFKSCWKPPTTKSFLLSKANNIDFSTKGPRPLQNQHYFEPTSNMTIPPETTQNVPQISYNPSPLPYNRIAQFENIVEQTAQNNCRRNMPNNDDKEINGSPIPFGDRLNSANGQMYSSLYPYNFFKNDTPTLNHTKCLNTNELLHGHNYNNLARGWRQNGGGSYQIAKNGNRTTELTAENYEGHRNLKPLPYTDF